MSALLSNLRNVLGMHIFFFLISIFISMNFFIENFAAEKTYKFVVTNFDQLLVFSLFYLFMIIIFPEVIRFLYYLTLLFPPLLRLSKFIKNEKNEKLFDENYYSLEDAKKLIINSNNKFLQELYWHEYQERASLIFIGKLAFGIILLLLVDFCLSHKSVLLFLFQCDSYIIILPITICLLAAIFYSQFYFKQEDRVILKKYFNVDSTNIS